MKCNTKGVPFSLFLASLATFIARVAPKSVRYSGTNSLDSHIAMVFGIHNLGCQDFFSKIFVALAVSMSLHICVPAEQRFEEGMEKKL
jgi:hypothetical protein